MIRYAIVCSGIILLSQSASAQKTENLAKVSKDAEALKREAAAKGRKLGSELALSPSRIEVAMKPGSSKTMVVKVIRTGTGTANRLRVRLNDWDITNEGRIKYFKPKTNPNSAAPWITYSPTELILPPDKTLHVRMTITVPKDAKPGDHTAALIIAPRAANLKNVGRKRRMVFQFRLAAIIYVMVPSFHAKPSLTGLKAAQEESHIAVSPTWTNDGNHRARPLQGVTVHDAKGKQVAKLEPAAGLPILAGHTLTNVLKIPKKLPAGTYKVHYRADFRRDGGIIEGRTKLVVK